VALEGPGADRTGSRVVDLISMLTELADLDGRALRAARAGCIEELCEKTELLLDAHVRFAGRYRAFLVVPRAPIGTQQAAGECLVSSPLGLGGSGMPTFSLAQVEALSDGD
jgi:hypothetical protein